MLPLPSVFCPAEVSGTYDDDDDGTGKFHGQLQQVGMNDHDETTADDGDDDKYTAFPPLLGEKPRMPTMTAAGHHHVQAWWHGLSATLYKLAQRMHQAHHASSEHDNVSNHHRRLTSSASHVFYVGDEHGVVLPVGDAVDLPMHHDGKWLSRNRSKTRNPTDDALLVDSYPSLELTVPGSSSDETSGVGSRQAVNDEDDASDDDDSSTSTSSSMSLSSSDDDNDSEFSSSDDECRRCSHSNNNDSDYFGDFEHGMSSGVDDANEGRCYKAVADLTSTSFSSDEEEQEEMEIHRLARLYRQRLGIGTCVAMPKSSLATVRVADSSWTGADGHLGSTPASLLPPPQVRQHPPPHRLRRRRRRHRSCSKAASSTTTSAIVMPDLDHQLTTRIRRSGPPVRSAARRHQRRLAPSVSPSPMPPPPPTRKSKIKARPAPAAASQPASASASACSGTKVLLPLPPLVGMRPRVDEDHTYLYISDPDDSDDDYHLNGHQDEKWNQQQPLHQDDGDGSSNSPFDPNHAGTAQLEFMSKVTRTQQFPSSRPSHSPPPACFWPALSTWFQKHSSSTEHNNLWVVPPPTPSPGPMMPH